MDGVHHRDHRRRLGTLRTERLGALERAVGTLTPEQREAFLLKHVEGMSYEQMASLTGATVAFDAIFGTLVYNDGSTAYVTTPRTVTIGTLPVQISGPAGFLNGAFTFVPPPPAG